MAPTPSQRHISTPSRTPQSKHRLNFPNSKLTTLKELSVPTEHPVEVITRIRNFPTSKPASISSLEVSSNNQSIRLRSDIGYRDFSLDGVSLSETEDLETFYRKFVGSRVEGVRLGAKCTIMMYGPTGSGKSHTMFGCSKEPGIVYRALRDILGEGDGDDYDGGFGIGVFVQVAVLEIYNEEIYDLLSGNLNPGGAGITQIPKGSTTPKVRLEVMGKKAKNATYISGNEAAKISREVAKVEKRRIVKSTNCNERSSRSHCLIILDVPSVGGRLMLVDMAGSENIEQAGQIGFEAKLQTAKINQGNTALKRVVESIANGDSHVPFRDSKLTMLLQDSFEDDKSKILMILCASPDPKEMHKTISTLEYGAKAKCIVRAAHISTPKDKMVSDESSTHLRSRIVAMNQFIYKLQMENKLRERERDDAQKELVKKEEELLAVKSRLKVVEGRMSVLKEEDIKSKVEEKTQILKLELMKMEGKMLRQQEELGALRKQLEEMELEKVKFNEEALNEIDGGKFVKRLSEIYGGDQGMDKSMESETVQFNEEALNEIDGGKFVKRLSEIYGGDQGMDKSMEPERVKINEEALNEIDGGKFVKRLSEIYGDQGMEKSMELDMDDQLCIHDVKEIKEDFYQHEHHWKGSQLNPQSSDAHDRVCLSTVFEREDEGEQSDNIEDYEVDKEVVEENFASRTKCLNGDSGLNGLENSKDSVAARKTRIQNIFRLCGNYRELAQQVKVKTPSKTNEDGNTYSSPLSLGKLLHENSIDNLNAMESPVSSLLAPLSKLHLGDQHQVNSIDNLEPKESPVSSLLAPLSRLHLGDQQKENCKPDGHDEDGMTEVYIKWEASKENTGNIIKKLRVSKDTTLSDLRKLIEVHLEEDNDSQSFAFLLLGDPTGTPVTKEKETTVSVCKLPICKNQLNTHLACLRLIKKTTQRLNHTPLGSLENMIPVTGRV